MYCLCSKEVTANMYSIISFVLFYPFYQNRITHMICGVAVSQDLSVLIHAARYRHLHVLKSWELCRLRIISCYLRIPLQLSF